MQEIRCKNCNKLLAIKEGDEYHIKSRRANIDIAFLNGTIICKCGTMFIAGEYFNNPTITK